MKRKSLIALMFFCLAAPALSVGQVTVSPAMPKAQEIVRVQVSEFVLGGGNTYRPEMTQVSMAASKITIVLDVVECSTMCPPIPRMDWVIGQLPAGPYQVEVRKGANILATASFTVSPRSSRDPLWNHTDLWWNPEESGWGINITQHGSGVIFATWFVYGADGKATWYVIPEGEWLQPTEYRGPIYRTTGPELAQSFNPAAVTRTLVGTAIFNFPTDPERAAATFVIDGKTIQKSLRRQSF